MVVPAAQLPYMVCCLESLNTGSLNCPAQEESQSMAVADSWAGLSRTTLRPGIHPGESKSSNLE